MRVSSLPPPQTEYKDFSTDFPLHNFPSKKMMPKKGKTNEPSEKYEEDWVSLKNMFLEFKLKLDTVGYVNDNTLINHKMDAYTVAYRMCTKYDNEQQTGINSQALLYKRAQKLIEDHLENNVANEVMNKSGDALLQVMEVQWEAHTLLQKWVNLAFKYLDQYYTTNLNIDKTCVMMVKCFQVAIFDKKKEDLRNVILANIEKERDTMSVERSTLKAGICLFLDMGLPTKNVYDRELEEPLIQATRDYYRKEAVTWLSLPQGRLTYLKKAESRILEELRRADALFAPTTKMPLKAAIEEELLVKYSDDCLNDPDAGTEALLINKRHEDLGQMYRLFHNIKYSLDLMATIVKDFIIKEGTAINMKFSCGDSGGSQGVPASAVYIKSCLALHDEYSELFKNEFGNDEVFIKTRRLAFEVFINPQQQDTYVLKQKTKDGAEVVTASELLSTYIDGIMKKEVESEEVLEQLLDNAIMLFTYINDKDLFQQFYMKQMSRRLMHNKNQRLLDQEKALISNLKIKMGSAYTSKLEGMLLDQDKSDTLNKQFKEHVESEGAKLPVDFSPLVLTTIFWPAFKHDTLQPPNEIIECVQQFEKYYDKNTQSRKLTWIHSLGQVSLQRKFPKGPPREMSVTPFQACCLLLFNDGSVVAKDASDILKLPFEEVKRSLHSLAYGKSPVIKRVDNKTIKQVKETDEFEVCFETFLLPFLSYH